MKIYVVIISVLITFSALASDSPCKYCDKQITIHKSVVKCFDSKINNYLSDAENGMVIVDFSSCADTQIDNNDINIDAELRLSTPEIDNKCKKNNSCGNLSDYIFLVSKSQLECIKSSKSKIIENKKESIVFTFTDCV